MPRSLPLGTTDIAIVSGTRNTVPYLVAQVFGGIVISTEAVLTARTDAHAAWFANAKYLLSDPQGADFRPYLLRILNSVRLNWFAVIPESARLGRRGKVVVQFAISKDGKVPKLIIASPSGADPLDRAAVAGISASNPFPPLPAEFKGSEIRLQLVFVYNGPR